jgi:hypothetical protein
MLTITRKRVRTIVFIPIILTILAILAILAAGCSSQLDSPNKAPASNPDSSESAALPKLNDEEADGEFPVTLYLPNSDANGFASKDARTDGTADHIVALLVSEKALPEGCVLQSFHITEKSGAANMNAAFGQAMKQTGTAGEYLYMGSLVNTLLTYFQLDSMTITVDGNVLETGHSIYDQPLSFFDNYFV